MAIFNEPGRGRRQCPTCQKYVGVMSNVCDNCKHVFSESSKAPAAPKVIPTYETGGPGKKNCPGCKKFVGARVQQCPCGHAFTTTDDEPDAPIKPRPLTATAPVALSTPSAVVVNPASTHGLVEVFAGSGDCPIPLRSSEIAYVEKWAGMLAQHYRQQGKKLTQSALRHFAGQTFPPHTEEYTNITTTLSLMD